MGRVCLRPGVAAGCAAVTARGPAAQGRCISLLPAVSAVSALFIAAAVSSHRRKGPVFSPHLGRTRGVRPPFLPGGIVCPAPKKETRCMARLFFCDCPQVLLCLQSAVCSCEPKIFFRSSPKISSNGAEQLLLYSSAKICLNYCGNLLDRITRPHKGRAIYSNS